MYTDPLFIINFVQDSSTAGLIVRPVVLDLQACSQTLPSSPAVALIPTTHQISSEPSRTFACDGPGRGGTCDVSAWDTAYLATFWVLHTAAWFMFYFHWRTLSTCESTAAAFVPLAAFTADTTTLSTWFGRATFGSTLRHYSTSTLQHSSVYRTHIRSSIFLQFVHRSR